MSVRTEAACADSTPDPVRSRRQVVPPVCTKSGQIVQLADHPRRRREEPAAGRRCNGAMGGKSGLATALEHGPVTFAILLLVVGYATCLLRLAGFA